MNGDSENRLFIRAAPRAAALGAGRALVLGKAGEPALVDQELLALAAACSVPATLASHAARLIAQFGLREPAPGALEHQLRRLAELGALVEWSELLGHPPPLEPPRRLATLAVVTRDRLEGLARCLHSHLAHLAAFGRRLESVVVVDASRDRALAEGGRARTQALAREAGARLCYLTVADREPLAARLAAAADVHPDLVRFALGEVPGGHPDTGGNRNALLLATAGAPFLSSDDDVIGDPHGAGGGDDRLHVRSDADPTEVALFETLEQAAAAAGRSAHCLLDAHESLLGRPLGALIAARGPLGVVLDAARPEMLELLGDPRSRAAVTSSAILGDSGAAFPSYYLWKPGVGRQLAPADQAEYARLIESRQLLRAVPAATIGDGPFLMSTHLALANDRLLPPFLPVLRGQDLLFGRLLRLCAPGDLIGHVPAAVVHAPVDARAASVHRLWPPEIGPMKTAAIMDAALDVAGAGLATTPPGEPRMRLLGRHLRELGSLPPPELAPLLRDRLLASAAPRLAAGLSLLEQHQSGSPGGATAGPWQRDLERYLQRQMEHLARAEVLVPVDLLPATPPEATARFQSLLRDFGRLLEHWPALHQAARTVRFIETSAEPQPRRP